MKMIIIEENELKHLLKESLRSVLVKSAIKSDKPQEKEGGVDFAVKILQEKTGRGTRATVYKMTHEGRIPHKKIGCKNVRFNGDELEDWIDAGMPHVGLNQAADKLAETIK